MKKKLAYLQYENVSLRAELERCRTSPFMALTRQLDNTAYAETPQYSRAELHLKLLPQIQHKSLD